MLRVCYALTLETEARAVSKTILGSDWPRLQGMRKSVSKQRAKYFTPTRKPEFNVK